MPIIKWFRSHRRSSTTTCSAIEDEATRTSATETSSTKHKTKRTKPETQRSRRSHSHGSGLRAMIGLGGSTQHELDAAAAVAAEEEEQRRISYQSKTRRRFTIHGLSYQHQHSDADWSRNSSPAGSPLSMYAGSSPRHPHSHRRSSRTQQMTPLTPDSHPSIIFIDCPP
ncbi:hypothetical protein PRIC1_004967 [Phytophthora ramorum]|uniref:Uncharacterized protein n=1 Tax=Phytophthora ramorum TaxID=164328 RepID=H3GUV9_PHYRM|nr:hypothetical protein KRP23_4709 [Phytophthora ramorum]KAH7485666.1 hypothetical protein KRP23_4710 [Phytophthora ramorum]